MNQQFGCCRFCAQQKPIDKLLNIQEGSAQSQDVVSKINHFLPIVNLLENLTNYLCLQCQKDLDDTSEFFSRVEKSQIILRQLSSTKIKQESDDDDDNKVLLSLLGNDLSDNEDGDNGDDATSVKSERRSATPQYSNNKSIKLIRAETDATNVWYKYPWMCFYCDFETSTIEELTEHSTNQHNTCAPFKCADCGARKLQIKTFIKHVKQHRTSLRRSCHFCSKRFKAVMNVQIHADKVHSTKYSCLGCNRSFKDEESLNAHKVQYYSDKRAVRGGTKVVSLENTCPVCQKELKSNLSLNRHMIIHTQRRKDHVCDKCGKGFYSKPSLLGHMLQRHENIRPHQCKICTGAFKSLSQLRAHVQTHDTSRPFSCDQCSKSFRRQKNLNSHMIVHTDQLPHVCEFCKKGFKFKTILKQHIRQHTGVKPYSCSLCQRDFTNWPNYNKHMKRRHGMNMAKTKRTPEGVFPINPITGEPEAPPPASKTEIWKKHIMIRKRKFHKHPLDTLNEALDSMNETLGSLNECAE